MFSFFLGKNLEVQWLGAIEDACLTYYEPDQTLAKVTVSFCIPLVMDEHFSYSVSLLIHGTIVLF